MTAMHWNAMFEAASLRLSQKKIIKKFLNLHFEHKIVVSDKQLASENEGAIQYEKHVFTDSSKREMTIWCRSLSVLLIFYIQKLERTIFNDIDCIEVCMGGDHGKNTCMFLAMLLFRHKSTSKETCRLELKLGEIDEDKDRLEHIEQLLKK